MHGVFCADLWLKIASLAAAAKERRGAVAFVTSDDRVQFGPGDTLITDASDEAIADGRTSAPILRAAHERGARLFSLGNLHAKLFCFDEHVVAGSANASSNSEEVLLEAAIISNERSLLAEARTLLDQLEGVATRIDVAFLNRIEAIQVTRFTVPRRQATKISSDGLDLEIGFFPQSNGQRILFVSSEYSEAVHDLFIRIGGSESKRKDIRVSWKEGSFVASTFAYYQNANKKWTLTVSKRDLSARNLYIFAGGNVGHRFRAILAANPTGVGDSLRLDLSVGT